MDSLVRNSSFTVPETTIWPPCSPGAGADVDDVVGGADRLFVVFDDYHGVAQVAEAHERVYQLAVVPLVQADRRFVQYVQDAHQAAADLGRQSDALGLTT